MALPIPLDAPVIMATLPSSKFIDLKFIVAKISFEGGLTRVRN